MVTWMGNTVALQRTQVISIAKLGPELLGFDASDQRLVDQAMIDLDRVGKPIDAITLADEAEAFRRLYNEIRPHETLDFATPLSRYLAEPEGSNLLRPKSVQDS